jgi:phospholipase A1/A2
MVERQTSIYWPRRAGPAMHSRKTFRGDVQMKHRFRICLMVLIACVGLGAAPACARVVDEALARCAQIADNMERLACYDGLAGREAPRPAQTEGTETMMSEPDQSGKPIAAGTEAAAAAPSPLSERWELESATKKGTFKFTPYQQNYFVPYHYTNNTNDNPTRPGLAVTGRQDPLNNTEATFQLSFKVKMAQDLFLPGNDLWFGYTQQSVWQMYNKALSSPFRNTDYQPEIMYVIPTDYDVLGLKWRMLNLGLVHQSNGRSLPLSRSWNRAYAQFGFERGNFALLVKPWYRFDEDAPNDDNPDITNFLGRGEVVGIYKWGRQEFSALWRNNLQLHDNRGSIRLDWSFPLIGDLRGYLQLFNGYGETLIDYNHGQTTFGIGVLLTNWM